MQLWSACSEAERKTIYLAKLKVLAFFVWRYRMCL